MVKKIIISGKEISYHIRKYKLAKNIRLSIRPCFDNEIGCTDDAQLKISVSLPKRISLEAGEKFIEEKKHWILEKINELSKNENLNISNNKKSNYKKDRSRARKIITSRAKYFSDTYGFQFGKIAIRAQRTRWGSCSRDGNLNFNYKLIYLSPELMDYVIVHELCHLDQFNHSKKFWFLVGEIIPNYRELRRQIKKMLV